MSQMVVSSGILLLFWPFKIGN